MSDEQFGNFLSRLDPNTVELLDHLLDKYGRENVDRAK